MERIVVVGAGAMGCLFAARLGEAGARVTLIDVDRPRIALLNRDGIGIADERGSRRVRIPAALAGEVRDRPDLLILFVKAMHSGPAIASVAHLAGPGCHALTLQNGIGNAEALAEVFGAERTLMGVTDQPADLHGATEVRVTGHGRVWLGGFVAAAGGGADAAGALFARAGFETAVLADAAAAVWEKAAFNAALNVTAAITGATVGQLDCEEGRDIAMAVVRETVAVAQARGIAVDPGAISAKVAYALANHRNHKASMLQDRLAGRTTEIDAINGAIVRAAADAGLEAPVNATLAALMRMIDRGYLKLG
ncbi:ketopantoate reductase family protein [Sphingomonas canadensis]|uniref:2-dehydropantoate 2-reductase n=1 Tax=Sphingomonas canadensis TaxID=1219257 RepID=A0ABW3H9H8_9SPHN|nr:ketopantoate reductase family protein [Sphingomonas canadensis]MCW3837631.1 ketopantoate reductase family protein [Sphingomonas canadensis]